MQIQTFSHKLSSFTFGSGDLSLQYYSSSAAWISMFSPTTSTHQFTQSVPSGMKTCCSSPSNWASERSGCLFIWQRTSSATTCCLNPRFLCCYNIITLILYPNWIEQKQNLTQFLSFSPPLQEKYSVCVAVQLLKVCSLAKCGGLFSFLFAFCHLHFFSTCWMKQTPAASGLRKDGVLCTPDFICAAMLPDMGCCLEVCGCEAQRKEKAT